MSVKDTLEAMIAGTHEDEVIEEEQEQIEEESTEIEEEVDESEGVDEEAEDSAENMVDDEDTDQDEESEEEEDTDEEIDESAEETSDDEEESEEEDAHEATDNESENLNVDAEEDKSEEEDTTDTSNDDAVDYKKFYEEVALAKFTANGREVEGFKDPADLIRAQQMLHGYSDKMKVFKEHKKFLKPLQERDILNDPDKFNLAMSLLDGDEEAIKKVIKDKGIDPLEMDLENITYTPKNTLPSDAQLIIEETSNQARDLGVEDKFHRALTNDFDDAGLNEVITNSAVRNDLLQHLKDGTYDIVQTEIRKMEMLDSTGSLDSMGSVDKYRMAIQRLQQAAPVKEVPKSTEEEDNRKKEEARIQKQKEAEAAEEYKRKAAKELEASEARKKAAKVSKKRVVKQKSKEKAPESLKGSEFKDYFNQMLMN